MKKDLPEIRSKLNEATAQLNEAILSYERLLNDKNMKVIVKLPIEIGKIKGMLTWNRGPNKIWCLGWEPRSGGEWSQLIHAPRHARIAAVSFFKPLFDAIIAEMAKLLVDTDKAVEATDRFLQAFHEGKKP